MTFPIHVEELLQKRYYMSGDVFKNYYGYEGQENWDMLCHRVAKVVSKNNPTMEEEYYKLMFNRIFLPNSPTLFGAGIPGLCLSACFIAPMEDSVEGWAKTFEAALKIQCAGGGIGFPLHILRPSGWIVKGKKAKAAGPVEFMKCWSQISKSFSQAVRDGANMGQLSIYHPDTLKFIECKDKDGDLSNFNISVIIPDKFMTAVKENKLWDFIWEGQIVNTIEARELWDKICLYAWKTGEPGVIFGDAFNRNNPHPDYNTFYGNPCGEATLYMNTACNLGSINLSKFVTEELETPTFDYDKFDQVIRIAYTFLDDLIDVNNYPTPEIDHEVKKFRPIGLGVMGLADVLIKLNLRYGSTSSSMVVENIMNYFCLTCDKMNTELAEKRGSYPYQQTTSHLPRLRNLNNTTVPPTGTTSMIAGCSAGIEPVFSFEPIKRIIDGKEVTIHTQIKNANSDINVTANDLSIAAHIEILSTVQKNIDMSISKTINLGKNATVDDVKKAFQIAYSSGCKCITVYRDGSRANQTIQTKDSYKTENVKEKSKKLMLNSITPLKRQGILNGKTFKDTINCGYIYNTVNFNNEGDIIEVFVRPGKRGGCGTNVEAIARLISLSLRCGVKVTEIIDQLKGLKCPACLANKNIKFLSCGDAIARSLEYSIKHKEDFVEFAKHEEKKIANIENNLIKTDAEILNKIGEVVKQEIPEDQNTKCPNCKSKIYFISGCRSCLNCGWSRCG